MHRYSSQQASEFKRFFKADLRDYWDPTGFDIVRFDDLIVKSAELSCSATVERNFGSSALALIRGFLTN